MTVTAFDTVRYDLRDHVATITLNRPDVLNCFDRALRRDLFDAITVAVRDDEVRVVILTGAGRAFSSGADLGEEHPPEMISQFWLEDEFKPALMAIADAPKPFIAAVNGPVAGGACGFALACDLSIMSSDAYLYQAFVAIGLIPDGGISWHFARQLGHMRAFELLTGAERISATRCAELGLTNKVVAPDELMREAQAWAADLAHKAPLALRYTKQALRQAHRLDLDDAISLEAALQNRTTGSHDGREGMQAFIEKRKPVFIGR